jgi:hypothetical protein
MEDLSTMLDDLSTASERIGLRMNMDKTKIMSNAHVVYQLPLQSDTLRSKL